LQLLLCEWRLQESGGLYGVSVARRAFADTVRRSLSPEVDALKLAAARRVGRAGECSANALLQVFFSIRSERLLVERDLTITIYDATHTLLYTSPTLNSERPVLLSTTHNWMSICFIADARIPITKNRRLN
jgi:hypothetical protein